MPRSLHGPLGLMTSSNRLGPPTYHHEYYFTISGGKNCDASDGCFMLLPIPLSWVVADGAGNQFVGIEFNPTARTRRNTFRLGSRQVLLTFDSDPSFFPSRFGTLLPRAPTRPTAAFSLFPSTPTNTRGLHTGLWVVGFH